MKQIYVSIFFVVITVMIIEPVFSESQNGANVSSLTIDKQVYTIEEDEITVAQIAGHIENHDRGTRLELSINGPEGFKKEVKTLPATSGDFSTSIILDSNWVVGDYVVTATYQKNVIGNVSFTITSIKEPRIPKISNIGTIQVERSQYEITQTKTSTVEIFGNIDNYNDEDKAIHFVLANPDGKENVFEVKPKDSGEYITRITMDKNWVSGTYNIRATYDQKYLGQATFVVHKIITEEQIPEWIKNNARWWSEETISDSEFAQGIEYMIKKGIIVTSEVSSQQTDSDDSIPDWVRSNARWWSDGLIPDSEFINSLEFLIKKGIIVV